MANQTHLKLNNGDRVAVIGGGPAGSFLSYFLLDMADRVGINLHVDVFEPRDFTISGPRGCNMCAGVLHESLVQSLATEGINLPTIQSNLNWFTSLLAADCQIRCISAGFGNPAGAFLSTNFGYSE